MKQLIQKVANSMGYFVARLDGPFVAIRHLLDGVADPVIFDVGAHHGAFSRDFRKLFPTARIYAFEPFRESYEILAKTVEGDALTRTFNIGLSDQAGEFPFYVNNNEQTNSLLAADPRGDEVWGGTGLMETKQVMLAKFSTIDDVMQQLGEERIDLLKMDVQGAEYLVMAGAAKTCRQKRISTVLAEFITQPSYEGQLRFDHAMKCYFDLGFDFFNFYYPSTGKNGRLRSIDAIFTTVQTTN